jgi:hypothetical protein
MRFPEICPIRVSTITKHRIDLKQFIPMKKYPVGVRVNRTKNDDEECAREVLLPNTTYTLF